MTDHIPSNPATAAAGQRIRVGISQGDTNGVGYELILKTFSDSAMMECCTPIVFGHLKVANYHKKALGIHVPLHVIESAEDAVDGQLNFVNCSDDEVKVEFGTATPEAGHAAFVSLEALLSAYKAEAIDVMVTAPIHKKSIQSTNFRFVGHTEYLQNRLNEAGESPLMVLCTHSLRVALVTAHIPVSEVAMSVTQERIEQKARLLHDTLCRDFRISMPRIAVLALNPHAGDGGVLGQEEEEVIIPAVKALSSTGIHCFGPYSADGFFGAEQFKHFDGVLAMYHDQGLTPFKALSMNSGVNFTAGLPVVRTSPDHGTAYDIAGKGTVLPDSFRASIFMAIDIYRNRAAYDESHANPLPKIYQEKKER